MKYLIIIILSILSVGYAGYYLYMLDTSNQNDSVPQYLTSEFWEQATPEQLAETLKNIENVNEAHPDTRANMILLLVYHGQYPEMIGQLVKAGVDVHSRTCWIDMSMETKTENCTKALHYAVIRTENSYNFTKELLKYDDQNIDMPDTLFGASPLHWALHARVPIEVIKLLLEKGANPNFLTTKANYSPLISASSPNMLTGLAFIDPEVIQLLLGYKADITIKNDEGKSAYDYMKENDEFVKTDLFKRISSQFQ